MRGNRKLIMSVRALVSTNLYVCGKERSLNTVRETHIDAEGKKKASHGE